MFSNGVLISNDILIFAVIVALTAFALFAERKWKWAATLSSLGICVFGALLLQSVYVLPTSSGAYDVVFSYVTPLAIPMVLLGANIKRIVKETGRTFLLFHIACIGAVIGSIVAGLLFKNHPYLANDIAGYVAMEVGVCTGGMANQAAMARTFDVSPDIVGAAGLGGCLVAVLFLVVIGALPNLNFFKKHFKHPYMDEVEQMRIENKEEEEKKQPLTAVGFGKLFAFGIGAYGMASVISEVISTLPLPNLLIQLLGNVYLLMTVITVIGATVFPKFAESLQFGQEIGMFMLLMYMVAVGTGATIIDVLKAAPIAVLVEVVIILFILAVTLIVGKLFHMNLEEMLICVNASYGGPQTAVAYTTAKGWSKLSVPGLLIGIYGMIIGNVLGILVGNLFL